MFADLIRNIPPAEPDLVLAKPAFSEEKEVTKLGTCAVALYDYQAADDTEISFDPDQVRKMAKLQKNPVLVGGNWQERDYVQGESRMVTIVIK